MSSRNISFSKGEYYHIYNRGNTKQKIFHDNEDCERFLGLLYACNQDKAFKIDNLLKGQKLYDISIENNITAIGIYCLMSNHFHLLVKEITEGGITIFMRKVMTAYVMYYNKKYKRTGKLFEGIFKAQHITNDTHLQYLFAYIHLNILKLIDPTWKEKGIRNVAQAIEYVKKYPYSSLLDYLEVMRIENKIINRSYFPNYFPRQEDIWKELFSWITL